MVKYFRTTKAQNIFYATTQLPNLRASILTIVLISCALVGCATTQDSIGNVDSYSGIGHEAIAHSKNGVIGNVERANSRHVAVQLALQRCYANSGKECYIWRIDGQILNSENSSLKSNITTEIAIASSVPRSSALKITSSELTSARTKPSSQKNYVGRRYVCSELNRASAFSLLNQGHSYLDRDGDGIPCEWDKPTTQRSSSNCHWVSGYRRKSGTYVRGHRRCR